MTPIYTVGHSNHLWHEFLRLLRQYAIDAVCDVRSSPYSRFCPQFNREKICHALRAESIDYIYLGEELGGRPHRADYYEGGRACYEQVARSDIFQRGIVRLKKGRRNHRIALMCAERDPLVCHRMLLVGRVLDDAGIPVRHILPDGTSETQSETLDRKFAEKSSAQEELFLMEKNSAAYAAQEKKVAYAFRDRPQ